MIKQIYLCIYIYIHTPKHTCKEMWVCGCTYAWCLCVIYLVESSHHVNQQVREDEKRLRPHQPKFQHDLRSGNIRVKHLCFPWVVLLITFDYTNISSLNKEYISFLSQEHFPVRLNQCNMPHFIQTVISNGTLHHYIWVLMMASFRC